jgi:uncharacterized protein (DUF2249 family)
MEKPNWFQKENIKTTLDARPILAAGEHPLARVLEETKSLLPGEIYELITPFPPVPMIEKLKNAGFDCFSESDESGLFRNYFIKV